MDEVEHPLLGRHEHRRHPPFIYKDAFERACYNVEVIDLAKFYSLEQIAKVKTGPRDYAKFLADRWI